MSKLCKAEKEYCIKKLEEMNDYIPFHYVRIVLQKAKQKGIIASEDKIRNIRNQKQFDKALIEIFAEIAEENKIQLTQ